MTSSANGMQLLYMIGAFRTYEFETKAWLFMPHLMGGSIISMDDRIGSLFPSSTYYPTLQKKM